MLNNVISILDKYLKNYAIVPLNDGTSSIVFFVPYLPYEEDKDLLFIDAYYKASNELYHLTNKIIEELNILGYQAKHSRANNMKWLAVQSGLTSNTRTTLVANDIYGTRIVLGVINIKGNYELIHSCNDICIGCNSCIKHCPTGALSNNGFNKDLCIRQLQSLSGISEDALTKLMGNKVWGCDICQKHCPINKEIGTVNLDKELRLLLDADNFINLSIEGKKGLKTLLPYIGHNYLNPKRLLALALNSANNMGKYGSIKIAENLIDNEDEAIRINAVRMLRDYNNHHNK